VVVVGGGEGGGQTSAGPPPVAHDEVGVEPQGRVDGQLVVAGAQQGGQPSGLPGVHEQEHRIVAPDQLVQPGRTCLCLHEQDHRLLCKFGLGRPGFCRHRTDVRLTDVCECVWGGGGAMVWLPLSNGKVGPNAQCN